MVTVGATVCCLDQVECLALFEADDGFLPVFGAAGVGATLTAKFAVVVRGTDSDDLFAEGFLDSFLDLELVGATIDFEGDFVVRLLKKGGLLAEADLFDDLVNVFHDLGGSPGLGAAARDGFESVTNDDDGVS